MVRRKNVTVFLDVKESTSVLEVKKMIKGILKKNVDDMMLLREGQVNIYSILATNLK